ncbi:hypothetical protein NECID01_0151 [Nematocida sp. AWRm77]|nr:hypothetical protein NECID01_0151 [Nematocida sp. AWRm77]
MNRIKPLQMEEKVERLHQLFLEKKTFFRVKDLEKIAPKEKGIVAQSVKDVVEILLAENKIKEDKIGATKYYWSFPSDITKEIKNKHAKLQSDAARFQDRVKHFKESVAVLKANREGSEERTQQLLDLKAKQEKLKEIDAQLAVYEENNPEYINSVREEVEALREETNITTEHIFILTNYLCNQYGMERKEFMKSFSIPEDMEDV